MDEATFLVAAEKILQRLEDAIEIAADEAGVDIDIEVQPGGVLQLSFENDSKIVINRHAAAGEIWVAARAGGFHFQPAGERWISLRDGQELWAALSALISQQAASPITLSD